MPALLWGQTLLLPLFLHEPWLLQNGAASPHPLGLRWPLTQHPPWLSCRPQGIVPWRVLCPSTRVMPPQWAQLQYRGSRGPCTPQSWPSPGSCRSLCWLPGDLLGQDLLLPDKPAGGTSSTSRGAAHQLLPPNNRKPHTATLASSVGAMAGHTLLLAQQLACAPAPWDSPEVQVGILGYSP